MAQWFVYLDKEVSIQSASSTIFSFMLNGEHHHQPEALTRTGETAAFTFRLFTKYRYLIITITGLTATDRPAAYISNMLLL
jgi:hypothetical protein